MYGETKDVDDKEKKLLEMIFDSEDARVKELLMSLLVRLMWLKLM